MKSARPVEFIEREFDALIGTSLRDSAACCRLPPDFTARLCIGIGQCGTAAAQGRLPRWAKVAVALVAFASLAGFAAWVGAARTGLAGGQPAGGQSFGAVNDAGTGAGAVSAEDAFDVTAKGDDSMIMARKMASLVGASLLAVSSPGEEITSEPTFVFLRPETSSFWNTATNSTMTLPIDYPRGATKATLTVSGVGYKTRTYPDLTGDSFELVLPVPDSPQAENVYDLALTFDDGTVRTAKLGLIQGLSPDSEGSTRCLAPAEGAVWDTIKKRAVMPIPYGTQSFTMSVNGGEWTTVDTGLGGAQGWYALKPANGSTMSLALTCEGINYAATLLGQGEGFMLILK